MSAKGELPQQGWIPAFADVDARNYRADRIGGATICGPMIEPEKHSASRAKLVNSSKRRRKTVVGVAKLEKAAAKELTKKSDSIVKSLLDGTAPEDLKRIRFLYDLAGDSTDLDESLRKRRSMALELAAEPPWRPEQTEADAETTTGTPESESEQHS